MELERSLVPVEPKFLAACVAKLAILPTRDSSKIGQALYTDNFIDACGHYPQDLWTFACIELLKTKSFRPSPAEFIAVAAEPLLLRQRMLQRVKQMLSFTPEPTAAFVPEPPDVRHRGMRDSYARFGKLDRAWVHEQQLASLEARSPDLSYRPVEAAAEIARNAGDLHLAKTLEAEAGPLNLGEYTLPPKGFRRAGSIANEVLGAYEAANGALRETIKAADISPEPKAIINPESEARLKLALAAKHRADGRIGYAKTLEAAAVKLWPALAETVEAQP